MRCTVVAGRLFPDGQLTCRDIGGRGRSRSKAEASKVPYSKCPQCGNVSHVNVSDPVAWYKERYPELPFMALVAAPCFDCNAPLEVGDTIEIRRHFSEHASWASVGATGTIYMISSCEKGSIYAVNIDGGKDDSFVRGEIRKPRNQTVRRKSNT